MKAERRHELKENDLTHMIESGRVYLRQHGSRVGFVAVLVIAVVVVTSLVIRSREAAAEDQWRQRSLLAYDTPEAKRASLESLLRMARDAKDEDFVQAVLIDAASRALKAVNAEEGAPDKQLNDLGRQAAEMLLERFPGKAVALGIGHLSLATVAENDFALDGDPAHKKQAEAHLSAILDNSALHTLPFYRVARDRYEALDTTFTKVVFAPPLPPEVAEDTVETVQEPAPVFPRDITDQLVPVEPPEWVKELARPGRGKTSAPEPEVTDAPPAPSADSQTPATPPASPESPGESEPDSEGGSTDEGDTQP